MAKHMTRSKDGVKTVESTQRPKPRAAAVKTPHVAKTAKPVVSPASAAPVEPKPKKRTPTARAPAQPEAEPPVAVSTGTPAAPRRRRSNKRSEQTIDNIFDATEKVVLQSGAERISILDVCNTAGVSRGTFYRYFASQDELLEAFSRYKRENFHKTLTESLRPYTDPDERFDKLVSYLDTYLATGSARRLLEVAPEFALRFYKRIFHDAVVRFQDLLSPVFDAWDERLGAKLDRELICDLLIRFVMSEQLIGGESDRSTIPRRIGRLVSVLRFGGVTRARR
jgi:AcrR family transcriptional regulator